MTIYESEHFLLIAPSKPHISREDGGHLIIAPKVEIENRTKLSPTLAIEYMKLTMIAGQAMTTVLTKQGIQIGRINYQDNGNWTPHFHLHLYGRALGATLQPYGRVLSFPATPEAMQKEMGNLAPLTEQDCRELTEEVLRLLATPKYSSFETGI